MPSFTAQVPNLLAHGPIVEIRLAVGSVLEDVLKQQQQPVPKPLGAIAMIDTGASGTVLREDLPQQLGLNPIGATPINTPSSTNVICPIYLVRIAFPNNVIVETKAIAVPLQNQPIQCLIGRDVLQRGVLVYVGYTNTFTLSF